MEDVVGAVLVWIVTAMLVVLASPSDFALEDEVVTAPPVEMDGRCSLVCMVVVPVWMPRWTLDETAGSWKWRKAPWRWCRGYAAAVGSYCEGRGKMDL